MAESRASVFRTAVSNATRYLCVAAHTDDWFAESVFSELFGDELRAVAPSFGFDVRAVALHCLAARQRRRTRDILLLVVGLLTFVLSPFGAIVAAVPAWFLGWVLGAVRPGGDGLGAAARRDWKALLLASIIAIVILAVAGVALLVTLLVAIANSRLLAPAFAGAQGAGQAGPDVVGILRTWLLPVAGWAALYVIMFWDRVVVRLTLINQLRWDAFERQSEPTVRLSSRLRQRLDQVSAAQYGNLTIYSGYRPFVGSGVRAPGWSFAMPLSPANPAKGIRRFTPVELIEHVRCAIGEMAEPDSRRPTHQDSAPPDVLDGLVVTDRVFVSGLAVRDDRRFVPDPRSQPAAHLDENEVRRLADRSQGVARHYLCAYVQSWDGEVVPFTFYHFATEGEKLYFECARSVLRPIRAEYRLVDRLSSDLTGADLTELALVAAERTVGTVLSAPGRLVADYRFNRRQARPRPPVSLDYGARVGVRELGAETYYHLYFQELDKDKHFKVVECAVLAAIHEFLEQHDVDTTEFGEYQTTIVNNGVFQTGGSMNVDVQSVGANAQASKSVGAAGAAGQPA